MRRRTKPDPALLVLRAVCHELRPPMATLTSLVRALEDQPSEVRRTELARLAMEHATHAQSVLNQAALVARGMADLPGAAVPLDALLPAVAATVPADRLSVRASPAAVRWLVHPQHTRQILINLLGNAARHSAGAIRLTARMHGRRLRLGVSDQGDGPSPALLTALSRQSPPPDDRGLGLWVVRQLTRTQGGTLRARALRPSGLLMEVLLPRYRG